MNNFFEKFQYFIIPALILFFILLVFGGFYVLVRQNMRPQPLPEREAFVLTEDIIRSITPPADAVPIEITPEMIESITPPADAVLIEITPEMIESITPPADAKPMIITPEAQKLLDELNQTSTLE